MSEAARTNLLDLRKIDKVGARVPSRNNLLVETWRCSGGEEGWVFVFVGSHFVVS